MYARHLSFLVTLSAACLLSGCLFFSDEEAGESQGNNTIPTEDMMTPPVADMGDMEVGTPEEDMPQTDMKVEIGCSSNDQCDDSEVCIDEVCQAPQCDPAAEQSMCPANQGCLQGQCIDLLANNEHCGAIGAACAQGTACAAGMCVCEAADTDNRMNFNTIAKSNLEDLQHYPSAQMITFNTEERYICTAPDTDELKECPNDQVQLNLEYPVDAPHYLVALTTGKKQLSLRLLDERGQQIPGTFPLNGDSDQFEDELVNYRLLATGLRQNLLIVWWRNEEVKEGEPTNFIKLYEVTVTPDNAVTSKPVLDEDDQPFVPLQQDNLRDFGLTFAEAPVGGVEALVVPYIYTSDSSDDALLQFVVYITTPNGNGTVATLPDALNLGPVRHSLRGIETLARFGNRGLVIEIVTIEADEDPLTVVGEYKRRSFLIERLQQAEFSQELSDFEQTYTMMVTVATNALSLWMDITFSDDRSDLPPTPLFFEQPGDDGQPTSVALSWVRQVEALTRRAELFLSIPDVGYSEPIESKESKYVYDQGFGSSLNTQDELPLMIWVEADQPRRDDASRTTRIRFAPILEGNDDSQRLLELGAETYASPDIDAQRISIAAGTRSTGVLAHGSDATRFFAIVDGKPVCRLLPPPSP